MKGEFLILTFFVIFYITNYFIDMERDEMLDILNGMCERCLMKGFIQTIEDAKTMYEVFDRFRNNNYTNDGVYSSDILYFYHLATKLHENGYTSLEESYSIYNAILSADRIDFVETDVKIEKTKKSNSTVVDISNIVTP